MTTRREFLQAVGGTGAVAAVGGVGLATLSGTAGATAGISITASNPSAVANDRGDIAKVTVDPEFNLQWQNLDDAVGKVFFLVEAKVGDSGAYQPIFRATPWLTEAKNNPFVRMTPGTTGQFRMKKPLSRLLNADPRMSDGSGPDATASPLVVADKQGQPDYAALSFPGGVTETTFLNGTSMGSASNYPGAHEDGGHQNNYHDVDAGYYGAAANTDALDNDADGTVQTTPVHLRYTFELLRPNLGQLKWHPDVDFTGLTTDEEKKAEAAANVPWVEVEDIDAGNSAIVMNGEDGNTYFGAPHSYGTGISYAALQNNADNHVGIISAETSFLVEAENEGSSSGVSGSSNTGAS